jgi:hypothetical protein
MAPELRANWKLTHCLEKPALTGRQHFAFFTPEGVGFFPEPSSAFPHHALLKTSARQGF